MVTKKKQKFDEKQRIITPEFRVSYPHLFKANSVAGSAPKYSVTMLFSKKADLSAIKLAIKHAKISAFGPNQNDWPDDLQSPVTDGDDPKYAKNEGYKGHWAIKASSIEENKPGLVDENADPILNQGDFYPGCYARAQVFARVWEYMGKSGIHFILDNVQKTRDGKSFSSKKSATDVFKPLTASEDYSQNTEDETDSFN